MDKKAFKITAIKDNGSVEYWKNKIHLQRLEALKKFGFDTPSLTDYHAVWKRGAKWEKSL